MKNFLYKLIYFFVNKTKYGKIIIETKETQTPVTLKILLF